jgi:hypothetical protein
MFDEVNHMRLTTTTNVSVDSVMQGLGGAHKPDRGRAEQPAQVRGVGQTHRPPMGGYDGPARRARHGHRRDERTSRRRPAGPGQRCPSPWLLANDLVDQIDLLTYPVVVGQGTRLFPESGPDIALELVTSRTTSRGITIQSYRPAGCPQYETATVDPEDVF